MKKNSLLSMCMVLFISTPICMVLFIATTVFLQRCSMKELPVNEYTSKNGMFTISLPGEWTEEDNMDIPNILHLSRTDSIAAVIFGIAKPQANVDTLEDFQSIIEKNMLNGPASTSKITETKAVSMPEMKHCIGSNVDATDLNGAKGKIFVEYMESEDAYYAIQLCSSSGRLNDLEPIKEKASFGLWIHR